MLFIYLGGEGLLWSLLFLRNVQTPIVFQRINRLLDLPEPHEIHFPVRPIPFPH